MLPRGHRLGRYILLDHIATGGMADVYRAKSVGIAGFEKILAVKRIRSELAREPRFVRSFIDEARIAVRLNHRNIVQVFDFGREKGELYLAMELIEGVDLRAALTSAAKQNIEFPLSLASYILADLGAGLEYAHRKSDAEGRSLGIVHCDVSPQNVMLSNEGFVKILDFGVARARFATQLTERRLRGKPRYMAPEQTFGDTPTPATDAFALGIIAWEILTGLPLFEGDDISDILSSVRRTDIPHVGKLNPDVPPYLADAIASVLVPQPKNRGTVTDVSDAAARAARELASVASSRALADWLTLVKPEPEDVVLLDRPRGRAVPASASEPSISSDDLPEPTTPTAEGSTDGLADGSASQGVGNVTQTAIVLTDVRPGERSADLWADGDDTAPRPIPSAPQPEPPSEPPLAAPDQLAAALLERRRAVVTAAVIDGGNPETRRELSRMLAELAYKRGARVHDQSDGALRAVFGLEVAGEDDVASAMQYCLDAVELSREAARAYEGGGSMELRLATRAGVLTDRSGGQIRLRGSAVEQAITLAKGAEPGRPLLTGGAGRLATAQFAFREMSARRSRRRGLRVLELIGPRDFEDRARVLTRRRGRFVGRSAPLAQLREAATRAAKQNRRVAVGVVGPPGIGKSRLCAEFVAELTAKNSPRVVAVAAAEASRESPFTSVTHLVQTALGLQRAGGEDARARLAHRLRSELSELDPTDLSEVVTALERAMELRDGALVTAVEASADLRERVTAAMRVFRTVISAGELFVTVLENLHAMDGASAQVFSNLLGEQPEQGPEVVIATLRLPADETSSPALANFDIVIPLGELVGEARAELIADRLGDAADGDATAIVSRRAGGNPLFIEEIADAVRTFGAAQIPSTVRDVLLAQLDRQPRQVKAVLQHAAVQGPQFRSHLVAELLGQDISDAIEVAVDEGLLERADFAGPEADAGVFVFRHRLLQEVVYDSLDAKERRKAHLRIGHLLAIRAVAGRDEPPAATARHLEAGGDREGAISYWLRAGELSLAAYDARAACSSFTRAIELAEKLGDHPAKSDWRREALSGRERAFANLGDHQSQASDLELLVPLCRGDATRSANLANRRAEMLLRTGDYDGALTAATRAEEKAAEAGDPRARGEALRLRAELLERTGDFEAGLEVLSQAIEIFRQIGAPALEMTAMVGLGRSHLMRSRYQDARAAYEPVLARLSRAADPYLERIVRNHVGVIHLCLGEFEKAIESANRSVEICEQYGDRARVGDNLSVCGIILVQVGRYLEAKGYFERALTILRQTSSRWSLADCQIYAGGCDSLLGDHEGALAVLEDSIKSATELGARYVLANAEIELAGVLLRRGQPDDAVRALGAASRAVDIAREATLPGAEVLALSRRARAKSALGDLDDALSDSQLAVAMLGAQQAIEGCEEEILYWHYRLLKQAGDPTANECLAMARKQVGRKLAAMTNPEWRKAFSESVELNVAIIGEPD